ncbi:Enhanced disease susceptibility 5 [Symbiodinium microadriaticum]|uniref:Enhanced disease susceptibility 5 n=1 Tax=Symbiodinium microadriaticum TaxID=2951 RepID=A0A1Q9E5D9_SYMMI|nr:Enhanced disease susceptibility 5 [Symbiodinium microadriaticum]
MMTPKRSRRPFGFSRAFLCILLVAALPPGSVPPLWWRKGRPRKILGSRAEAELLSQLAVLLMPEEPISQAFRDFPVERCQDWGSSRLSPDFAAYGVLKATDAALFIEYDGYYRHTEPPGLAGDMRKTRALIRFAPAGSVVVRIAHKRRQLNRKRDKSVQVVQVLVDCWCNEHAPSLLRVLVQVVASLLHHSRERLLPALACRLAAFASEAEIDNDASIFANKVGQMVAKFPRVLGYSIEENLKPTVEWIKGLGLSQENLKPTVEWIKGLGLSQAQVAKVMATSPSVLGLSIEENLKPTVEWIKGLGLSQAQVAKVIATSPSVLGYSIEENLKPTVEWIKGLGLSQAQVAKVMATSPSVLGLSIEENLKPTVEWIKGLGLSQAQVAKVMATSPSVLGLSIEENLKPTVEWIKGLGLSQAQVAKVMATSPSVLGLSIEENLKPTVEWIKGLGLSQAQVSDMMAMFPPILGLSIETNLAVKHRLLQKFFPVAQAAAVLAHSPRLWSYRYARLEHRLAVLKSHGQLSKLSSAVTLPLEAFNRRAFEKAGRWQWALRFVDSAEKGYGLTGPEALFTEMKRTGPVARLLLNLATVICREQELEGWYDGMSNALHPDIVTLSAMMGDLFQSLAEIETIALHRRLRQSIALKNGFDSSCLLIAACGGVVLVLGAIAFAFGQDAFGDTALHRAASFGHVDAWGGPNSADRYLLVDTFKIHGAMDEPSTMQRGRRAHLPAVLVGAGVALLAFGRLAGAGFACAEPLALTSSRIPSRALTGGPGPVRLGRARGGERLGSRVAAADEDSPGTDVKTIDGKKEASSKTEMLRFALPALGIYLANPIMSNIDNSFVGHFGGTTALAALSPGGVLADNLLYLFNSVLSAATTGLVARAWPKGAANAREELIRTFSFALACGVPLSLFYWFCSNWVLGLMGVPQNLQAMAASYARIRGLVSWASLGQGVCLSAILATRDAVTPLRVVVLAALLNVLGDFLLCCWPLRTGVSGAAAATAISTMCGFAGRYNDSAHENGSRTVVEAMYRLMIATLLLGTARAEQCELFTPSSSEMRDDRPSEAWSSSELRGRRWSASVLASAGGEIAADGHAGDIEVGPPSNPLLPPAPRTPQ